MICWDIMCNLAYCIAIMIRLFSVNSRRKTFNAIPSRWRKSKRKNQASVLLRPREKSRVYSGGTCERKKGKKLPIECTSGALQDRENRSVLQGHLHEALAIISSCAMEILKYFHFARDKKKVLRNSIYKTWSIVYITACIIMHNCDKYYF